MRRFFFPIQIRHYGHGLNLIGLGLAAVLGFAVALWPSLGQLLAVGALIVALGGIWVTLQQPLVGVAVVLLLGPLGAWEARTGVTGLPLASGQIALMGVAGIWLVRFLALRRTTLPSFTLFFPLAGFIAVMVLTALSTADLSLTVKELLKWIELLLIVLIILDGLDGGEKSAPFEKNRPLLWLLLTILLLPAVVQAFIGLGQFIQPDGPESFLILGRFFRAFGTFEQPNPFGGFIVLHTLLLCGVVLGLLTQGVAGRSRIPRSFGWLIPLAASTAVLGLLLIAVVASWSRGAWLGLAVGGSIMAALWPRRLQNRVLLLSVIGLAGLLLLQADVLPASISSRVTSAADIEIEDLRDIELTNANFALVERLAFWDAAAGMFRQKVWLGIGFGAYDAAYPDFSPEGWPKSLGHAHNYYLNLLAETGLIGTAAYLLLWGVIMWQAYRLVGRAPAPWRGVALGLLGAWVALSVHHLVDKLYVNNLYLQLGGLLALQQLLVNFVKVDPDRGSEMIEVGPRMQTDLASE